MNSVVSIQGDVANHGHLEFTLAKTGPNTASLDVRDWPIGSNYLLKPATDNTYELENIIVNGNVLTCTTPKWPLTPTLKLTLSKPPQSPSISLVITGALWNNATYVMPLSSADYQNALDFLTQSAFPIA
jgi:hypothetical protein